MFEDIKLAKKLSNLDNKDKMLELIEYFKHMTPEDIDECKQVLNNYLYYFKNMKHDELENNKNFIYDYIKLSDSKKEDISKIKDNDNYVIVTIGDNDTEIILSDENNSQLKVVAKDAIKNSIIDEIGRQAYEEQLEDIDYDLAMAYKEADYQMARGDALEAELAYYKAINDPSKALTMKSPQLLTLWKRYQELKSRYDNFA